MELIRAFQKLIAPYARRIYLMIGRGVVKLIDDSGGLQRLQVTLLDGETRSNIERFQNYGHTANPPAGAEGIAASVTGSRDHLVMIALDHPRYRKKGLKPGEGGLYDDIGQSIILTREGIIIKSDKIVRCEANLHVTKAITCDSDVSDKAGSMAEIRLKHNLHTHQVSDKITAPPTGTM